MISPSYYGSRGHFLPSKTTKSSPIISFSDSDFHVIDKNLYNHVVISVIACNYIDRKVLKDHGSSTNILFFSTFMKMHLSESALHPYNGDFVSFSGVKVNV